MGPIGLYKHTDAIVRSHMRHPAVLHHRPISIAISSHSHIGIHIRIRGATVGALGRPSVLLRWVIHHVLLRLLVLGSVRRCRSRRAVIGIEAGRRGIWTLVEGIALSVHGHGRQGWAGQRSSSRQDRV